jgi:NitT/TauT family transport system ATP-binding protein
MSGSAESAKTVLNIAGLSYSYNAQASASKSAASAAGPLTDQTAGQSAGPLTDQTAGQSAGQVSRQAFGQTAGQSGSQFASRAAGQTATLADGWTIRDLGLSVFEGEIVCILGASGCGKSTLLNLIAGLLQPNAGTIEITSDGESHRRIGYIFQQDALLPWRTVEANVMLAAELSPDISKEAARKLVSQYLQTFNLNDKILKQYPVELSGGMRQRVSIIQSLMFNPTLFLLDEPFSALDFFTKLKLEGEFYQLIKEKNKAAILVTHDIEECVAMADRILLMSPEGNFTKEFVIDLGEGKRSPEAARGTARFADYYSDIWSELKAVIEQ